ncbi:MAG: RNA modification enzyme, MiaB family [Dehalococcoidia bacterium]|nr:RNA modification enzyme, MiaB family [Dehalococcoidia bacterium]
MSHYYLWTIGCQMNQADSQHLSNYLESQGFQPAASMESADLVLLNSCVVRQSAEDRVIHQLASLKALKDANPSMVIGLTGCLVDSNIPQLQKRFPQVDVFFGPQAFGNLEEWMAARSVTKMSPTRHPACSRNGEPVEGPVLPTAFVPVIQGCDSFCTYCVVPFRRGREKSRPIAEIACEVKELVRRGVKEVTLLGQKVDAYGHDLPETQDLADLLTELNTLNRLSRIRFLTSHPQHMTTRLIDTIARLDKVCEHINLPVQSGDDGILTAMRREYTVQEYRELIKRIRSTIDGVALSTDVIVGFPDETEEQFQHTLELIQEIRFDSVHVARYSPRPGTWATRHLKDNVPHSIKRSHKKLLEATQSKISLEINQQLLGKNVEILVEGIEKDKWRGRTRTDKLVFFPDTVYHTGKLLQVKIEKASPWWLEGKPT